MTEDTDSGTPVWARKSAGVTGYVWLMRSPAVDWNTPLNRMPHGSGYMPDILNVVRHGTSKS